MLDLVANLQDKIIGTPYYYVLPIVFLAALLSSVHCISMCGVFCLGSAHQAKGNSWYYQLGRLFSYLLLALLFAGIGRFLVNQMQPFLFLVFLGLIALLSFFQMDPIKKFLLKLYRPNLALVKKARMMPPKLQAYMIGMASGLLPCGLLYTFLFAALAVQSVPLGLGILFTFWLGTLPALQGLVYLGSRIPFFKKIQKSKWRYAILVFFLAYSFVISYNRIESVQIHDMASEEALMCH